MEQLTRDTERRMYLGGFPLHMPVHPVQVELEWRERNFIFNLTIKS